MSVYGQKIKAHNINIFLMRGCREEEEEEGGGGGEGEGEGGGDGGDICFCFKNKHQFFVLALFLELYKG